MIRISTALPLSLAAALVAVVALPSSASAATTDLVYSCVEGSADPVNLTYSVTISAPETATRGTNIPLTVTATKPAPADIPAKGIDGTMEIRYSGAASGKVTASGLVNAQAVPKGQPLVLGPGKASVPATTAGVYKFAAGARFDMKLWVGETLSCTRKADGPSLAQTVVK
ncbi:hypothetical protein [Streptomyces decoyicus]|uniref:hypothetical protein n=1 Tax=Streptomyces decoyicus TaxID=249567 RepID=UPI003869DB5A